MRVTSSGLVLPRSFWHSIGVAVALLVGNWMIPGIANESIDAATTQCKIDKIRSPQNNVNSLIKILATLPKHNTEYTNIQQNIRSNCLFLLWKQISFYDGQQYSSYNHLNVRITLSESQIDALLSQLDERDPVSNSRLYYIFYDRDKQPLDHQCRLREMEQLSEVEFHTKYPPCDSIRECLRNKDLVLANGGLVGMGEVLDRLIHRDGFASCVGDNHK